MQMEINMGHRLKSYLSTTEKAAPLVVFRILFGLVMCFSMLRFWINGWIEELYLNPKFHFKYDGFGWVEVLGNGTYFLFIICGLSAFCVAIGYKYRLAIILFFCSFLYIELLDKTNYLNHYYFISVISFMLIWLPAHCNMSLDARKDSSVRATYVHRWQIDVIKWMLAIVYIYAGFAKLNYDWMVNAMPLTIWLPTKTHLPLIGGILDEKWIHYLFSWGGAIYDLTIVFFLLWKRTRIWAFMMVVIFHALTRILFPIGMFPYIMILSTLIFFSSDFHERILKWLDKKGGNLFFYFKNDKIYPQQNITLLVLAAFMCIQLLFPLRYLEHDGNVFWHERGYRYAWRVMLMEKTGYANFKIVDGQTGNRFYVQNDDFLTPRQEKEMATQPDFILQYGKYLGNHFALQGHQNVQVFVESYASLNGRRSQIFIDPKADLMQLDYNTLCNYFLIPMNE